MKDKEIFPEAKVGDIIIRPWKFGVLFKISSFLEEILDKMEAKNVNIETVDGFVPYTTIARIFTMASDSILKIIAITIEKPEEEIAELDMDEGLEIATIIYNQNTERIKKIINEIFIEKVEDEKSE